MHLLFPPLLQMNDIICYTTSTCLDEPRQTVRLFFRWRHTTTTMGMLPAFSSHLDHGQSIADAIHEKDASWLVVRQDNHSMGGGGQLFYNDSDYPLH